MQQFVVLAIESNQVTVTKTIESVEVTDDSWKGAYGQVREMGLTPIVDEYEANK